MARRRSDSASHDAVADKLASLLAKCFDDLETKATNKSITTGEFLKMLELYCRLAPEPGGQKALWDLLEEVRRQVLPPQKAQPKKATRRPRTATKKEPK